MNTEPIISVSLVDAQETILREIKDKKITRESVALTYYFCMKSSELVDWKIINAAIIERWSVSGLNWIKQHARSHQ